MELTYIHAYSCLHFHLRAGIWSSQKRIQVDHRNKCIVVFLHVQQDPKICPMNEMAEDTLQCYFQFQLCLFFLLYTQLSYILWSNLSSHILSMNKSFLRAKPYNFSQSHRTVLNTSSDKERHKGARFFCKPLKCCWHWSIRENKTWGRL